MKNLIYCWWKYSVCLKAANCYDKLCMKVAWLLPRRIVMWAYVRLAAHATQTKYSNTHPDNVSIIDAMGCWQ